MKEDFINQLSSINQKLKKDPNLVSHQDFEAVTHFLWNNNIYSYQEKTKQDIIKVLNKIQQKVIKIIKQEIIEQVDDVDIAEDLKKDKEKQSNQYNWIKMFKSIYSMKKKENFIFNILQINQRNVKYQVQILYSIFMYYIFKAQNMKVYEIIDIIQINNKQFIIDNDTLNVMGDLLIEYNYNGVLEYLINNQNFSVFEKIMIDRFYYLIDYLNETKVNLDSELNQMIIKKIEMSIDQDENVQYNLLPFLEVYLRFLLQNKKEFNYYIVNQTKMICLNNLNRLQQVNYYDLSKEYTESITTQILRILDLIVQTDLRQLSSIYDQIYKIYSRVIIKQQGVSQIEYIQLLINNRNELIQNIFNYYLDMFFYQKVENNFHNNVLAISVINFLKKIDQEVFCITNYYYKIFMILVWFPHFIDSFVQIVFKNLLQQGINIKQTIDLFNFVLDLGVFVQIIELQKYLQQRQLKKYHVQKMEQIENDQSIENHQNQQCENQDQVFDIYSAFSGPFRDIVKYHKRHNNHKNAQKYSQFYLDKQNFIKQQQLVSFLPFTNRVICINNKISSVIDLFLDLFMKSRHKINIDNIIILVYEMLIRFDKLQNFNEQQKRQQQTTILKYIQKIFKEVPQIIIILNQQIQQIIGSIQQSNLELCLVLIWAIGESIHTVKGTESDDIVGNYIEQLEITINTGRIEHHQERLLTVTTNSLFKIAVKFKQFIPKVILIYHKIQIDQEASNLVNMIQTNLKMLQYSAISSQLFDHQMNFIQIFDLLIHILRMNIWVGLYWR